MGPIQMFTEYRKSVNITNIAAENVYIDQLNMNTDDVLVYFKSQTPEVHKLDGAP